MAKNDGGDGVKYV